jgi:hypothetical protein
MKKRLTAAAVIALVLAGCTGSMAPLARIDVSSATTEQYDRDRYACWGQAWTEARTEAPAVTEPHPSIVAGFFIVALGLIALGANAADFADTGPSPEELERTCMLERGYALKEETR